MDTPKWAERETQALIAAGVNPIDAQRSVAWTLATMPPYADPATWISSVSDIDTPIDKSSVQDARVAWYARKAAKIKRLLDPVVKK